MFTYLKNILFLIVSISLINCKSETKETHTYFGGKIIKQLEVER